MAKGTINVVISGNAELLRKELKSVSRSMQRTGRDLQQIGGSLFKSVAAPMLAVGAVSVNTAMRFERMEMGLRSVMGSSAAAAVELEKLRKVAQLPGVSLEQAIQGSTRLQAVGINAELARDAIQEFGNALAVSGGSAADLDGVILALTQMKGAGKILTQDLRQITSRIPMLASVMKKQFGTDVPEEINKMGISFEEFSAKIIAGMQSEIPRASNTLENSFVNLRLAGEGLLSVIGKQLIEDTNLQAWIEGATKSIDNIAKSFGSMSPLLKGIIYSFAGIGTILGGGLWIGGKIYMAFAGIATAVGAMSKTIVIARDAIKGFSASVKIAQGISLILGKSSLPYLATGFHMVGLAIKAALRSLATFALYIAPLVVSLESLQRAMTMSNWVGDFARQLYTMNSTVRWLLDSYIKLKGAIFGVKEEEKEASDETQRLANEMFLAEQQNKKFTETMALFDAAIANSKKKEEERAKLLESTKKIYGDLREELQFLTAKQELYGDSLDEEKIASYESAIDSLLKLGFNPMSNSVQKLKSEMEELYRSMMPILQPLEKIQSGSERFGITGEIKGGGKMAVPEGLMGTDASYTDLYNKQMEKSIELTEALRDEFQLGVQVGQQLGSTLADLATKGELSMKKLGQAAMVAAGQVVRANLMKALSAYLSDAFMKLGILGGVLAGAGTALVGGLFDAAISKVAGKQIPALAQGGMTRGPGLAMIGDNSSGKEFVIPFERMGEFARQAMGGNNVNVAGEFRVKGSDLVLVLERANRITSAKRGYGLNG